MRKKIWIIALVTICSFVWGCGKLPGLKSLTYENGTVVIMTDEKSEDIAQDENSATQGEEETTNETTDSENIDDKDEITSENQDEPASEDFAGDLENEATTSVDMSDDEIADERTQVEGGLQDTAAASDTPVIGTRTLLKGITIPNTNTANPRTHHAPKPRTTRLGTPRLTHAKFANRTFKILNINSSKILGVKGGSKKHGADVVLGTDRNQKNGQWKL